MYRSFFMYRSLKRDRDFCKTKNSSRTYGDTYNEDSGHLKKQTKDGNR